MQHEVRTPKKALDKRAGDLSMGTTREEISGWFERGVAHGATHMIVVCDTFDWDDYPVFVKADEQVADRVKAFDGVNMQKIMEIYNLSMDRDDQLAQHRAYNL